MSEKSYEELVRIFDKKGLTGIMESQEGKTIGANVPMSPTRLRSPRKVPVQLQSQPQKVKDKIPGEVSIEELRT